MRVNRRACLLLACELPLQEAMRKRSWSMQSHVNAAPSDIASPALRSRCAARCIRSFALECLPSLVRFALVLLTRAAYASRSCAVVSPSSFALYRTRNRHSQVGKQVYDAFLENDYHTSRRYWQYPGTSRRINTEFLAVRASGFGQVSLAALSA